MFHKHIINIYGRLNFLGIMIFIGLRAESLATTSSFTIAGPGWSQKQTIKNFSLKISPLRTAFPYDKFCAEREAFSHFGSF